MKYRINTEDYKVNENYGNATNNGKGFEGRLITPDGIVEISTYFEHEHIRFDTVHNGRHYIKTYNDVKDIDKWTAKRLHINAGKFMREIVSQNSI